MIRFPSVKVLIWDVDGTFYPPTPDVVGAVLESAYRTIEKYTRWPREKVIEEFEKVHDKVTPSQTQAVSVICNIPVAQAARDTDSFLNRTQFISRDERLIALFEKLRGLTHYILGNGAKETIREGLAVLGLDEKIFEEIVTSETVGENKPSEKGYRYIMGKTGLPADAHLMIGDREHVDLAPAHALGMKTCLVWATTPGQVADVSIPTVYDLAQFLM